MLKKLACISLFVASTSSFAQYYDTLPKGVRLVMSRYVHSDIKSSYNHTNQEQAFNYEIDANIKTLEDINDPTLNKALEVVKPYSEAYDKINLGSHKIEADAQVDVNVFGGGYGITDRVTAYVGFPIYKAKVNVDYKKTKNDSNKEVSEILQNEYGDNLAQSLGNFVENIYDINGSTIQSAFVNAMGYNELGDWEGQGLGDTELGIMYNFIRESNYGFLATFGVVAPTGYVDDPDIIQDIGFGDGQWDAFIEFGGGRVLSKNIVLNAYTRYTHQFASQKTLRVPYSEDVSISDQKSSFTEKLGNKLQLVTEVEYIANDWLKFKPAYIYKYTGQSEYESSNSRSNQLLEANTESYSSNLKLLGQITSVNLFHQKKFLLPAQINASYQTMLSGKNTPKSDLLEIEFRMFF